MSTSTKPLRKDSTNKGSSSNLTATKGTAATTKTTKKQDSLAASTTISEVTSTTKTAKRQDQPPSSSTNGDVASTIKTTKKDEPADASSDNIQVAVRVRPFSDREINRNAQLIVQMDGQTTVLVNPNNTKEPPKKFTYDHSYWSHDQFTAREDGYCEPDGSKYADQTKVFNDLGRSMLKNAWLGYNCSIFAYGQTGSGKSYSIMGHDANKGLVPRTCEELFQQIAEKKSSDIAYEVTFSMMEIYNEQVHDLLTKDNNKTPRRGLKVKEHPEKGFYVESLKQVPVGTFEDIQQRINEGNKQRTIAATKMNETSSRAHTIVAIGFIQNVKAQKTSMQSVINLVDLAGSERQKQTESTGDRFTEAKNINLSLSSLGNVIHALVENASKKNGGKLEIVRYRDSVLTMLLKNALGGNSKTVMLAAISPDAENYDQTLSTLRYADRVKEIRTDAKVNKVDTDKLIQSLIADKEKLLLELHNAKIGTEGYTQDEIRRLREEQEAEIQRYRDQMKDMELALENRLAAARKEMQEGNAAEREQYELEKRFPHLSNLNEDPALTGKLVYFIRTDKAVIGNDKDSSPDIVLRGPGVVRNHAQIVVDNREVTLERLLGVVLHNGREIDKPVVLNHGDRIRFGSNNLYLFRQPGRSASKRRRHREMTYEDAQEEIMKYSGLDIVHEDKLLQSEVMNIMPMVQSVNAMAEDMELPVEFSMLLVSPEARGLDYGRTEVFVKMTDTQTGNEYPWDKNKFIVRYGHMQDMYQTFEADGSVPQLNEEENPFWEPADLDVIVGVALVPLSFLSYMIEFQDEPLSVMDYMTNHCGYLEVELIPCDRKGVVKDNLSVKDPKDLIDKSIAFTIKIGQATNLPARFVKTWCRYKFHVNTEFTMTEKREGQNPRYNHEQLTKISKVDYQFLKYLEDKSMPVEIWGQQGSSGLKSDKRRKDDKQRTIDDLQQKNATLEAKLAKINKVVDAMPDNSERNAMKMILDS